MLAAQSGMAVVAVALAVQTVYGRETLWLLYVMYELGAATGAFDNPARQALIARLVPAVILPGALALNLAMFQTALIMGPAFAGLLIAVSGTGGFTGSIRPTVPCAASTHSIAIIYALNAVSFLGVIAVLATLKTSGRVDVPEG